MSRFSPLLRAPVRLLAEEAQWQARRVLTPRSQAVAEPLTLPELRAQTLTSLGPLARDPFEKALPQQDNVSKGPSVGEMSVHGNAAPRQLIHGHQNDHRLTSLGRSEATQPLVSRTGQWQHGMQAPSSPPARPSHPQAWGPTECEFRGQPSTHSFPSSPSTSTLLSRVHPRYTHRVASPGHAHTSWLCPLSALPPTSTLSPFLLSRDLSFSSNPPPPPPSIAQGSQDPSASTPENSTDASATTGPGPTVAQSSGVPSADVGGTAEGVSGNAADVTGAVEGVSEIAAAAAEAWAPTAALQWCINGIHVLTGWPWCVSRSIAGLTGWPWVGELFLSWRWCVDHPPSSHVLLPRAWPQGPGLRVEGSWIQPVGKHSAGTLF